MRPSKDSKQGRGGGVMSGHLSTLHQRLFHALNLGTSYYDGNELKWKCADIEIQRHVVRSIAAFLDSISAETLQHPLVKDSVPHIVGALVWILQNKSGAVLRIAANEVVKLLSIVPSSVLQHYVLDLSLPLLSLLSSRELEVSISCAVALNMILSKLSVKNEKKVWEMMKEIKTIACIVTNIKNFSVDSMPIEYFQEMSSLLSIILWRWPPSRYSVWNDAILMKVLGAVLLKPDLQIKVAVLKLFSSLGLCGNGAKKLLENGEALLQTMVYCMDSSHALAVRMEGFRLAQCLATDEQGCSRMTSLCCVPLVKAIVCGMNRWSFHCGKISNDQMSLLVEACRLASSITRWAGQHHISFWKYGIDKVLVDLLLENFRVKPSQHLPSLEEQISLVQEGLDTNFLLALRPYIWDTLGCLATHCDDDFNHVNELRMNIIIACACVAFVDAIRKGRLICENDVIHASRSESASRAVLMMIYSPCKYIASKARFILSKILKPNGKYLKQLLHFINYASSGVNIGLPHILQTIINLVGLTCYLGMPQYQRHRIGSEIMKTLLTFVRWCWSNPVHIKRHSIAPHSYNKFLEKTCCRISEEWEGENVLLLYALWALAELVHNLCSVSCDEVNYEEAEFFSILQEICNNSTAHGPRWLAAYILSHFGFYGFRNKIGNRIGKALNMEEYADMQLILASGEALSVHGVVLVIRCPSLLPPDNEKTSNNSSVGNDEEKLSRKFRKAVRFSAHVDTQALLRLLDFVYFGYMEAGEELVKKLKPLAKSCNFQLLLQLLYRKRPKWGTPVPGSDLALALALGPVGHHFSDIILEAKATELSWTCSVCSLSVPHKHVHKVILWSSCDYLRALFDSGMLESHSQNIGVPVSWEAMVKLVEWFYTDQLPDPPYGCSWDNMDNEEKLNELHPYIELCWLSELWLLEDIQDVCFKVVVSCLDSELSIKVMQITAKFSLWKLAEFAAACMAPLYCTLRDSGDLEELDEFLVDMVRAASVRHSQGGG